MEDTFSDANVEQCDNTGFAYCFAQGTGISEYLVQTMQQRVTKGRKTNMHISFASCLLEI